jgi:hypothetical protein
MASKLDPGRKNYKLRDCKIHAGNNFSSQDWKRCLA